MSLVSNWRERHGRYGLRITNGEYGITLGASRRIDIGQFNQDFLDNLNGKDDIGELVEIRAIKVEEKLVAV